MLSSSCGTEQTGTPLEADWKDILQNDLHLLGHRNWILVVDKAFPEQSSAGMKYMYVEQDLLPTLEYVLQALDGSSHVKPIIYQDKELSFITEEQVQGIEQFRSNAAKLLRLHDRGRIGDGMIADLVVLDDAGAAVDIMARGNWHVRDGKLARAGTFENI